MNYVSMPPKSRAIPTHYMHVEDRHSPKAPRVPKFHPFTAKDIVDGAIKASDFFTDAQIAEMNRA